MIKTFRGNGKLLLTGEYFVLDGVAGLAVPTRLGQTLQILPVHHSKEHDLYWRAYDNSGERWFSRAFAREEWRPTERLGSTLRQVRERAHSASSVEPRSQVQSEDVGAMICQLLSVAEGLRPGCTTQLHGYEISTRLEFDRHWGLGSSSTLVACLAQLLEVDPYDLLALTFGGSGYDLACAVNDTPILYEREGPKVTPLSWRPAWVSNTVFVYRNQKQNSREGIRAYRSAKVTDRERREIHDLSLAFASPTLDLRSAAQILRQHETIVAETIDQPPIQDALFSDFPGQLKSLGAWGGDFFWALSEEPPEKAREYFNERGYMTVIGYDEMVL